MADKKGAEGTKGKNPHGLSDDEWTHVQREAAQQGISTQQVIERQKDPLSGLGVTVEKTEKKEEAD